MPAVLAWALTLGVVAAPCAAGLDQARLNQAIDKAQRLLLTRLAQEKDLGQAGGTQYGGATGLWTYALLSAGVTPEEPALARAIDWLKKAKLTGTYAVAMRACAFSLLKDPQSLAVLREDVTWLLQAGGDDAAYSYTADAPQAVGGGYDNSNTQMAMLAIHAAEARGVEAPAAYWRKAEQHWLNEQLPDGGFGYHKPTGTGPPRGKGYGSMTAAGLASLFICFDHLRRNDFVRCSGNSEFRPITDAMAWIDRHFAAGQNPGTSQWQHYWLFSLERVGLTSGHKYFGKHDWYLEGTAELLATQALDGRWGYTQDLSDTCFALMFLVRGRNPVVINKLRYKGKWNARPRDAANLARWLSWTYERMLSWQIVEIDTPPEQWQEAPILYLSGAGPIEITDAQAAALRTFALQGGVIVSEAACNNGDFTLDMQKLYARIFPEFPLRQLPDDHPIYTFTYDVRTLAGLQGVSNGVRLLAIHAPRELSLAYQLGAGKNEMPWFHLAANIFQHVSDRGNLRPRASRPWPAARPFTPVRTLRVARLRYEGNWNPEPLALERLAIEMGNAHRIRLDLADPVPIENLDIRHAPVAIMTGTGDFTLTAPQKKALASFLQAGGTLLADAAGGSREFDKAFVREVMPVVDGTAGVTISSGHEIYTRPTPVKVAFRREFGLLLGSQAQDPRLRGALIDDRLAILYSRDDLTAALVGYERSGLHGYRPETALSLLPNILLYAAGSPEKKLNSSNPASAPTPQP